MTWRERAACRGEPVAMFFPEVGESTAAARAVCARCPVSHECLHDAIVYPAADQQGVRGGTTDRERRPLRAAHRQRDRRTG